MAIIKRPAGLRVKELPGLVAWWDFSDVSTYGTLVSGSPATMRDKSGNANFLTTGASNTSPIAVRKALTGRNAIDGATAATSLGYSSNAAITSGELLICYAAMYPAAVGSGNRVVSSPFGGNWLMGPYSNNWAMYTGAGFIGSPGAYPIGTWAVHTGVVSAAQNLTYHHGNGVLLGSAVGTGYPVTIGVGIGFGENPRVHLGEIIALKTSSESVRLSVQDYLMRKWGAGSALPQSRLLRAPVRRVFFSAGSIGALTGTAAAVSTATGTLTGIGALTGTVAAASTATGILTSGSVPTPTPTPTPTRVPGSAGITPIATRIPQPGIPFTNSDGKISREWLYYTMAILQRTGGDVGIASSDLQQQIQSLLVQEAMNDVAFPAPFPALSMDSVLGDVAAPAPIGPAALLALSLVDEAPPAQPNPILSSLMVSD